MSGHPSSRVPSNGIPQRPAPGSRNTNTPINPHLSNGGPPAAIAQLLRERGPRLEADKKAREAGKRSSRKVKADASQASITAAPDSAMARQANHAKEVQRKQAEEKKECVRILARIEQDKVDRKEEDRQEKEARGRKQREDRMGERLMSPSFRRFGEGAGSAGGNGRGENGEGAGVVVYGTGSSGEGY